MKEQHSINVKAGDDSPSDSSIISFITEPKRPMIGKSLYERLQYLFVRWIVCMHISMSIVENPIFRELLRWFNADLICWLPKAHKTIKGWIMDSFKKTKDEVRVMIQQSKSNIHLSFDLWTSNNSLALLGIIAHFVDDQHQIRTVMLVLRRVKGAHTGENLAVILAQIIHEYDFIDRLGYFVLDNASSNNTCIDHLLRSIAPHLQKKHRRLRCMGHIINLAAQALLIGKIPKVLKAELALARALDREQEELILWRQRGPIGKLHNIVKYIRITPQRREKFLSTTIGDLLDDYELDQLMVISDNATRWNSADDMIERGLKLRRRIDIFCLEHHDDLIADYLTGEEWQTLISLHDILKPF